MATYAKRHHRVAAKEKELERDFLEKNEECYMALAVFGGIVYGIAILMGVLIGYLIGKEK